MKNKYIIILGIIFGLMLLLYMDRCGQSGKYQELKTEYNALKKVFKANEEMSRGIITKKDAEIVRADEKIKKLESTIVQKNKELERISAELGDVEDAYNESAPKDEQIANLKKQVELWKNKFQLASQIIEDKDGIIFSLTQKYEAQLIISNEWKTMYEYTTMLKINLELQVKTLKGQLTRTRLGSGIKNVAIAVIGGFIIYELVKD